MTEVKTIGNIHISVEWQDGEVVLILFNQGSKIEPIDILHLNIGDNEPISWKYLKLHPKKEERVKLTEEFIKCDKFGFKIQNKYHLAQINELTKLLNESKPPPELQKSHYTSEPGTNASDSTEQSSNSLEQNQKLEYLQEQITQLEKTVAERENKIDRLKKQIAELSQENSELNMLLETRTEVIVSDPEHVFREAAQQIYQMLLTQRGIVSGETFSDPRKICEGIETEIKRFEEQYDGQMNYTLSIVKEHLTKVNELFNFELSELSPSESQPEHLAKLVLSDAPPKDVQFPYLGELGKAYWNDLKTFTTKLPQVIEETQAILHRIVFQLLDGFSPYHAKDAKEEQMTCSFYEDIFPNILQMMDLELVPIEIGQTEADSRIHDIQGSQRGAFKRGVVADIIQHGIYRISDKQIIRKPVVMRGEPE